MTINRYNYEVFIVDYLDGNLNPSLTSELMMFLDQNPDLKEEFEGIEDAVLVADNITYMSKADLKKKSFQQDGIDNEQDYRFIASIEGVLSANEQLNLEKEIKQNEETRKEFNYYKKTVIQPAPFVEYPDKLQLKRSRVIPIRIETLRRTVSIAASITLLVGVYTIGKLIINENELPAVTSNIAAANNAQLVNTTKEILIGNETPVRVIAQPKQNIALVNLNPVVIDSAKTNETNRQQETLPAQIACIESRNLVLNKNIQYEQIALALEDYSIRKDLATRNTINVADNTPIKSSYREVGLFEILQYGVHSFGKLIGKDIKLTAKKDKTGRIEEISFESNLIAFSKPVRKKE